jgi:hypothetical protein
LNEMVTVSQQLSIAVDEAVDDPVDKLWKTG